MWYNNQQSAVLIDSKFNQPLSTGRQINKLMLIIHQVIALRLPVLIKIRFRNKKVQKILKTLSDWMQQLTMDKKGISIKVILKINKKDNKCLIIKIMQT